MRFRRKKYLATADLVRRKSEEQFDLRCKFRFRISINYNLNQIQLLLNIVLFPATEEFEYFIVFILLLNSLILPNSKLKFTSYFPCSEIN